MDVCGGLVEIDECSGTVILTHYTIQEYLVDPKKSILPGDANFRIIMACTTYLTFDTFAQGPCRSEEFLQARLKSHPFLGYAAHYLFDHLQACEGSGNSPTDMLLRLLSNPSSIASYLQVLQLVNGGIAFITKTCLRLHAASLIGYTPVVLFLLKNGANPSLADENGKAPLHIAAFAGHREVAQLLLDQGRISPRQTKTEKHHYTSQPTADI